MKTIKFIGDDVTVKLDHFPYNGDIKLELINKNGRRVGCASLNTFNEIKDNEVAIKNWSENMGILDKLLAAGIVENPHGYFYTGLCRAPICYLT